MLDYAISSTTLNACQYRHYLMRGYTMNAKELRAQGFSIYPVGRKVCFVDCRSGYTSPAYDPDTCESKLLQYIGAHRVDTQAHGQSVMPL